ncbi:MAG TPA: hypothetical protein VJ815_07390 [Acidimicrobiia bacterium]|nr:hypothetical protein [Acidimicrobiia bacterium]
MKAFWILQATVLLLMPSAMYAYRHRTDLKDAARGATLSLGITFTVVFGLFMAGETAFDVGGWRAAGLIALWLVPLLALASAAWFRPQNSIALLAALIALGGGLYLWSVLDPMAWSAFENAHGPIRTLVSMTVFAPIALLGRNRPRPAGIMLLALASIPVIVLLASLATGMPEGWPLLIVSLPAAMAGVLYLLSAMLGDRQGHPGRGSQKETPQSVGSSKMRTARP